MNSALQRARATLEDADVGAASEAADLDEAERALLERYVEAFERYDMEALTSLIHEDATQSMPPYDLWLRGRDDILSWWVGPGAIVSELPRRPDHGGKRLPRLRPVQAQAGW